jgi:hypothetical protein
MLLRLVAVFDRNPFTVHYQIEMRPRRLTITAEGESTFSVGTMSESEKEALRQQLFAEVKADIQAVREKELTVK